MSQGGEPPTLGGSPLIERYCCCGGGGGPPGRGPLSRGPALAVIILYPEGTEIADGPAPVIVIVTVVMPWSGSVVWVSRFMLKAGQYQRVVTIWIGVTLSLIHISEPTRQAEIS